MGRTKHGLSKKPEYQNWKNLTRKRGPNCCQGWQTFEVFFEDTWERPETEYVIKFARTDKTRDFSCGKCEECIEKGWIRNGQWMDFQNANQGGKNATWIEFRGERKVLAEWARDLGTHPINIARRLEAGWSLERALTTPPNAIANQPDIKGLDHPQTIDLTGKKFNKLTVIKFAGHRKKNLLEWLCKCDCGRNVIVTGRDLKSNHVKSCGCLTATIDDQGRRPIRNHPLYIVWIQMRRRCKNDSEYAGRGIKVCERWQNSFHYFIEDMGERPEKHSLERLDNDAHYSCGKCEECLHSNWSANCVWATRTQQVRNRRNTVKITAFGQTLPLAEWADIVGISHKRISSRIQRGWSAEKSLTTPVTKNPHISVITEDTFKQER